MVPLNLVRRPPPPRNACLRTSDLELNNAGQMSLFFFQCNTEQYSKQWIDYSEGRCVAKITVFRSRFLKKLHTKFTNLLKMRSLEFDWSRIITLQVPYSRLRPRMLFSTRKLLSLWSCTSFHRQIARFRETNLSEISKSVFDLLNYHAAAKLTGHLQLFSRHSDSENRPILWIIITTGNAPTGVRFKIHHRLCTSFNWVACGYLNNRACPSLVPGRKITRVMTRFKFVRQTWMDVDALSK